MADAEDAPTENEIRFHLQRILASANFSMAITQSKILKFIVEKALLNEPIREIDIADEIEATPSPDSHPARSNVSLIRRKIKDYYASEGINDLVTIKLPAGPAYLPKFSYNEDAEAIKAYRRGVAYQGKLSLMSLTQSQSAFTASSRLSPGTALLHASWSETDLLFLIYWHVLDSRVSSRAARSPAKTSAFRALEIDPKAWRAYVVLGSLRLLNYNWIKAGEIFGEVLEFEPQQTGASLWYALYLMTVRRTEESLQIVKANLKRYPDSLGIHLAGAFLLYLARDFDGAHKCLIDGCGIDWSGDLQKLLVSLIFLENGTLNYGLDLLVTIRQQPFARPIVDAPEVFPGLIALSLVRAGNMTEAREVLAIAIKRKDDPTKPSQLAVGYMAIGRDGRALALLRRAYRQGDILLNWLHLMPLFDPLRNHPRFQELLKDISTFSRDEWLA